VVDEKQTEENLEVLEQRDDIALLEEKNQVILADLQRLQADFANYRKRVNAEQSRLKDQILAEFAKEFLPVVDNLERAVSAKDASSESLEQGVRMTMKGIEELFQRLGITPIEALGQQFDPRFHEAMLQVESEEHANNEIVEELQKGYIYQDRLLRPSLVKVALNVKEVKNNE